MNVIVAHNFYQQPGGEDQVFASEVGLLRRFNHTVRTFVLHNDSIPEMGRAKTIAATMWNGDSYRSLRDLARATGADVVHFHNTFPLISPAAYMAAHDAGAAVVQTLHNFRLVCPAALLFRDGHVCESCLGRGFAWPGVVHGCYRSSRSGTAIVAGMVAAHRALRTWSTAVDVYITPTASARSKLINGGLPPASLLVKPNFIDPDPGAGRGSGGYAIFVGRLSHEKGLETLLAAWLSIGASMSLKIVGDGPMAPAVRTAVSRQPNVQWLGRQPLHEVYRLLGEAAVLLVPSLCYETFGRVIIEAFAKGTPVIASRLGAMADLIQDGRTGLLFQPGNAVDLTAQVRRLLADPRLLSAMRAAARSEYESHYTGARNHEQLLAAYAQAVRQRDRRSRARSKGPRAEQPADSCECPRNATTCPAPI